jgi:hypothetical protein
MSAATIVQLVTAGDIAARLRQPLRRVLWVLATRPHIRPAARAGRTRVYSTSAVALVQDEIDRIDLSGRKGESDAW